MKAVKFTNDWSEKASETGFHSLGFHNESEDLTLTMGSFTFTSLLHY